MFDNNTDNMIRFDDSVFGSLFYVSLRSIRSFNTSDLSDWDVTAPTLNWSPRLHLEVVLDHLYFFNIAFNTIWSNVLRGNPCAGNS